MREMGSPIEWAERLAFMRDRLIVGSGLRTENLSEGGTGCCVTVMLCDGIFQTGDVARFVCRGANHAARRPGWQSSEVSPVPWNRGRRESTVGVSALLVGELCVSTLYA